MSGGRRLRPSALSPRFIAFLIDVVLESTILSPSVVRMGTETTTSWSKSHGTSSGIGNSGDSCESRSGRAAAPGCQDLSVGDTRGARVARHQLRDPLAPFFGGRR